MTNAYENFDGTGALSANWTAGVGFTAPTRSGGVAINPSGGDCGALWTADTLAADAFAEIDVTLGAAYCNAAVVCCFDDTFDNGYWFFWEFAGSGNYVLQEVTAGAGATLASAAIVGTTGTRRLRIERDGNDIVAYANGVEVLRATDTTRLTGRTGFSPYFDTGSTPAINNFATGPIVDVNAIPGLWNSGARRI